MRASFTRAAPIPFRARADARPGRKLAAAPRGPRPYPARAGRVGTRTRSPDLGFAPSPWLRGHASARCSAEAGPAGGMEDEVCAVKVRVVTVVPSREESPYDAPWLQVMTQMARRLNWADPSIDMAVITQEDVASGDAGAMLAGADLLLAAAVEEPAAVAALKGACRGVPVRLFFESDPELESETFFDGYNPNALNPLQKVLGKLPLTKETKDQMIWRQVQELWARRSSEDLLYTFLFIIDRFIAEVALIPNDTSLSTITCMLGNCREEVFACVQDETCKAGLDCLDECGLNDQVCSYRCIVSYESELFEKFSLCILQKHNCLGNDAEVPTRPEVHPSTTFRGQPLTWESAEEIFLGWLGEEQWSWRVVCGVNPAYDWFPCQYQLWYFGRGRGQMWYDPVFKVKTLDGGEVWRRRHYRVRRAEEVGSFYFSVLDNGVTSNEFWRIVECAEDMSWALFYYAGAASAAGISYTGAVLATRDGMWPAKEEMGNVEAALAKCGIEMWEICRVDNRSCGGAPLDVDPKAGSYPAIADRAFPPGPVP